MYYQLKIFINEFLKQKKQNYNNTSNKILI